MRVAFASIDNSRVDQHFGDARYWQIYDIEECSTFVEARKVYFRYSGHHESKFQQLLSTLYDCEAVFVSRIGEGAAAYMIQHNKRVFEAAGEVSAIISEIVKGNLL